MAMEKEGQTEVHSGYPRDIIMKDGTVRRVKSYEDEVNAHREENED